MATTVGDIISRARELLQDADADSYRFTDTALYNALNNAFSEARRARGDMFLSVDGVSPTYLPADAGEAFPLDAMYTAPFIEYVAGFAELRDDEYTGDGRAITLVQIFNKAMIG